MTAEDHAIISIHPQHVESILKGRKTVELRRRFPRLAVGAKLWIYSTLPVGAVVASARIGQVETGLPSELWKRYGRQSAITADAFNDYFAGCTSGFVISLTEIESVTPIALAEVRKIRGTDHIPQVASRISPAVSNKFAEKAASSLRLM